MGREWRKATVMDLQRDGILLVEDGNHGEYRPRPDEFVDRGVAFIRAADMDNGRVLFLSASKINDTARKRITKGIGAAGDVLLSHKGTVGKVALVPDNAPPFVCSPQTTFWRTLNEEVLDRKYLHAFLRSPAFHQQLATRAGETDMAPYVSLTSQRGLSVTLPSVDVQRAIGRILSTLDDKIELNRRMNETLEAMARAIFKSWFVDFDPVRAKMDGRQPVGMDAEAAQLFPDGFSETELGHVPRNWAVATPKVLMSFIIGGDWGKDSLQGDFTQATYCIRGADIPNLQSGGVGKMPTRYVRPSSLARRALQPWDLAFEISGGSPTQSTGRPVLVTPQLLERLKHPLICSNFCRLIRPEDADCALYLYWILRHLYDCDEFLQYENGTTGIKNFAFTVFCDTYKMTVPPVDIQRAFNKQVTQLASLHGRNGRQCETLAVLRDTLLPKLLSGEIRVPVAEKMVEEVM